MTHTSEIDKELECINRIRTFWPNFQTRRWLEIQMLQRGLDPSKLLRKLK